MAKRKREDRLQKAPEQGFENKALSGLAHLRLKLTGEEAPPAGECAPSAASDEAAGQEAGLYGAKLVISRERKGHGGKTATRLTGLQGTLEQLDGIAKELRKALGCGANREDADILLQGVQGPRLETWLRKRGAQDIVRGN